MKTTCTVLSALVIVLTGVGGAAAQESVEEESGRPPTLQIDDRFALRKVEEPRVSPDGVWVAFTVEADRQLPLAHPRNTFRSCSDQIRGFLTRR